jgi:hypothetical protein
MRRGGKRIEGWVPSNTHPSNTRVVASNIDTLHASYFGPLRTALAKELAEKRTTLVAGMEERRRPSTSNSAAASVLLGAAAFELHPCMARGYRYRLVNSDLTLMVAPEPRGLQGNIRAQLGSAFLWREGWSSATAHTEQLIKLMIKDGILTRATGIGRIDICVDFQGWEPTPSDLNRFIARAEYSGTHNIAGVACGLTFGKGGIVARIYDKTLEIGKSSKDWMIPVWASSGFDYSSRVWRLEFQVGRPPLLEMKLACMSDALKDLGRLWSYLTTKWLRLTEPDMNRRERWRTDRAWEIISKSAFGSIGGPALRERVQDITRERIIRGLLGYVKALAALNGHSTLKETMRQAECELAHSLTESGQDFEGLVQARRQRASCLPAGS